MCHLYGFRSNEPTKVECTLVRAQNDLLERSVSDRLGRVPADGWGIACYTDPDNPEHQFPDVQRNKTGAFEDTHFSHTAESLFVRTVIAHVRSATVGYVGTMNSHPFSYDAWTFAHYGTIPSFDEIGGRLADECGRFQNCRIGNTDSEQLFLWLLARMAQADIDLHQPNLDRMCDVIGESITRLDARCRGVCAETPRLTFILTNGRYLLACCWNKPVHWVERQGIQECEICSVPHIRHDAANEYRAVVVASEPITDENWQELPNQSLLSVDDQISSRVSTLNLGIET